MFIKHKFINIFVDEVTYEEKQAQKFSILNKLIEKVKKQYIEVKQKTTKTPSPRHTSFAHKDIFLTQVNDDRSNESMNKKKTHWADKIVI